MRYFEVDGESPNEILEQFIMQQNLPREFVVMEVIEQGSKGILGIGKKPAKVKIIFDDHEYLKRKAKLYVSEILDKGGFDYHIEVKDRYPDYILNIISEDSNILIGKTATTLDSLQYLVDRLIREEESDINIYVDVDNYRERVVAPLKEKAIKLAHSVKKSGRSAKMSPMATLVRREIHIAVKSIPGVSTISHGDGQVKALTIVAEKRSKGGKPEPQKKGGFNKVRKPRKNTKRD